MIISIQWKIIDEDFIGAKSPIKAIHDLLNPFDGVISIISLSLM